MRWGGGKTKKQIKEVSTDLCDKTPYNCNNNLINQTFTNAEVKTTSNIPITYGKSGTSYSDAEFNNPANTNLSDCGVNLPCRTDYQNTLQVYVSYPKITAHDYNACKLPAVFLWHPGGFSDCNSLANEDGPLIDYMSKEFARRGFVCYVFEYRRGRLTDPNIAVPHTLSYPFDIYYTGVQQVAAYQRAIQDCSGGIRSMLDRQANNLDEFKIDPNNIFLAGASAGAIMVTLTAYYTQDANTDMLNPVSENVLTALGARDIDYYTGPISVSYKPKIKGVLSMWGNGFLPLDYAGNPTGFFAQNANNPPMIAFQGINDPITPINSQAVYYSPSYYSGNPNPSAYHTITDCLTASSSFSVTERGINQTTGQPLIDQYRAGAIYYFENVFNKPGFPVMELNVDCNMAHGLDDDGDGFDSEFGTHLSTRQLVFKYMTQRAATFFQTILAAMLIALVKDAL